MTEGDEVSRLLCRHDPRQPSDGQHVPFLELGSAYCRQRLFTHADRTLGSGHAVRFRFGGDVDHSRFAAWRNVRKLFGHLRSGASRWRMNEVRSWGFTFCAVRSLASSTTSMARVALRRSEE